MEVREVAVEEWARFRDLRLRALREDPEAFGSTLEREAAMTGAEWRERFAQPGSIRFVAKEGGAWLGLAGGATGEAGPELFGMWVAPEARGRGVGRALVEAVVEWARGRGFDRVSLWVNVEQAAAQRLYEKCGFRRDGPPRAGTRDPTRVFQRMVRALGGPAQGGP